MKKIPVNIQKLLGKPPLLPNQSIETYEALCLRIADSVVPIDAIEWLWVNDIVYYTWDILWLRKVKVECVKTSQHNSYIEYCERKSIIDKAKKLEVKKFYQTSDKGTTNAYLCELETLERIDVLLAAAESRRNAALHEIERHRASFASRLRKASDDIIDCEFTEPAASGPVSKHSVILVNHDPVKPASAASGQVANVVGIPVSQDSGKPASADSGLVKKTSSVKNGIAELSVSAVAAILKSANHGPKKGVA